MRFLPLLPLGFFPAVAQWRDSMSRMARIISLELIWFERSLMIRAGQASVQAVKVFFHHRRSTRHRRDRDMNARCMVGQARRKPKLFRTMCFDGAQVHFVAPVPDISLVHRSSRTCSFGAMAACSFGGTQRSRSEILPSDWLSRKFGCTQRPKLPKPPPLPPALRPRWKE